MASKRLSKALWGASLTTALYLSNAPVWSQLSAPSPDTDSFSPEVSPSPPQSMSQKTAGGPAHDGDKPFWKIDPSSRKEQLQSPDRVLGTAPRTLAPCVLQNLDCSVNNGCPGSSCHLVANFPETQWDICIKDALYSGGINQWKGLGLGPVWLKKNSSAPWMPVLYEAGMAEAFNAYHRIDLHYYDTYWGRVSLTAPMTPADAGFGGLLLTLSQATGPTAVAECRNRGLAWFCHNHVDASMSSVRRGEELVIWANYDTGNYDYILEYGFRDDGTMTFRMGASGFNNTDAPDDAHIHDVLWRVDMDLGGYPNDRASLIRHVETSTSGNHATDLQLRWNNDQGTEGVEDWNAAEFTTVLVEDTIKKNYFDHNIGYELQPLRTGTSKHFGYSFSSPELWTQHDFWVTRYHPAEETSWANPWQAPDYYLMAPGTALTYPPESTQNGDLVLWYHSGAHHDPIDEDRWIGDSTPLCKADPNHRDCWTGITLFHWQGFDLVPHNLFDYNPLGGPRRCH